MCWSLLPFFDLWKHCQADEHLQMLAKWVNTCERWCSLCVMRLFASCNSLDMNFYWNLLEYNYQKQLTPVFWKSHISNCSSGVWMFIWVWNLIYHNRYLMCWIFLRFKSIPQLFCLPWWLAWMIRRTQKMISRWRQWVAYPRFCQRLTRATSELYWSTSLSE